jgi:hypothetical protein
MAGGMMQILAPYVIRRGTGNELDGTYIIPISADSTNDVLARTNNLPHDHLARHKRNGPSIPY